MSDETRGVLLLGPEGETSRVATALEADGHTCHPFTEFEAFMGVLLSSVPDAVVVWDSRCREELEAAVGLLRHHVCSRRSPFILARAASAGAADCELVRSANAVVDAPVDPAELCAVLDGFLETTAESGDIPRILVVDDDENIVLLASHIVSGLGMIPLVAFNGREAVAKTRQFYPDLILLDINMPDMDGFEVINILQADAQASMIPIIVFSARKSEEDKVRALKLGADDYVTKPFNISEMGARIDRLLSRTRAGVSASSTTGLPGSVTVEQAMVDRIRRGLPFAVLYVDADHFKAFNDCYGFSRGDSVIRQIADILIETSRELGGTEDFVGHIGGDDFVTITDPELADVVAQGIIDRFDRIIPFYYNPEDRTRGAIATEDRRGQKTTFPLMTLSIAVVTTAARTYQHAGEVADVAAQLKKLAKSRTGSVWVKDQRSDG